MSTFTDYCGIQREIEDIYTHLMTNESATSLSFIGLESFFLLYDVGLIVPDLTHVRIDDGEEPRTHYVVRDKETFELIHWREQTFSGEIRTIVDCFLETDKFSLEGIFIPKRYNIRGRDWDVFDENSPEYVKSLAQRRLNSLC